jgi:hypothetical protein
VAADLFGKQGRSRGAGRRPEPEGIPLNVPPPPVIKPAPEPVKPAAAKPAATTTTIRTATPAPMVVRPAPAPVAPARTPEPAAPAAPAASAASRSTNIEPNREPVVQTRRSRSDKANAGMIVPIAGLEQQTPIRLPSAAEFSVGRFPNPDQGVLVALDEKSISRKHATLTYDSGANAYFLTDNNSSYGTFVLLDNRLEQLTPGRKERIFNDDVVQFGNQVQVRLTLPTESRSNSTRL